MRTLRVVSMLAPFGSETPLQSLAEALVLVTEQLSDDLRASGVRVELDQRLVGGDLDPAMLASLGTQAAGNDQLLVLPPHGAKTFEAAVRALAGSPAIVMGINGGDAAVAGNPNAFNIGIHDAALRAKALQRIIERHGGMPPIHLADGGRPGALDLGSPRAELVDAIRDAVRERGDRMLLLSVAAANGPAATEILREAGFRGLLVRDKGTSFPVPEEFEVIDVVGSFVDLPTMEFRSLIQRALGPVHDGDPLLRDLMSVAWRLDAMQVCAAALHGAPGSLAEGLARFRPGGEVFPALTRRIAFTSARVNAHRGVAIVRRAPGGGRPHLYPVQLDDAGRESAVAFTSCKALWIGDVVPATGTFAADLELDVSSATPVGIEDVVFVNASEAPEVAQGAAPHRADGAGGARFGVHARIRGTFRFDPEVSDFPFDRQRLPILIEVREQGRTRPVQPVALAGAKSPRIEGWDVETAELGRSLSCRPVPDGPDSVIWVDNESAVFAIVARRRIRDALTRTAIPLGLILLLVWATGFWDDGSASAEVLANGFLACVALYLAEQKPVPGRTTFIDRLFLVCNIMVGVKLVLLVATFGLDDPTAGLSRINTVSLFALPVVVLVTLAAIWPRTASRHERRTARAVQPRITVNCTGPAR
jgi:hypothetical protein